MCLINCKKVRWNTSLYAHIEQVGWKSKFNVYQNEQYIMSYQSYSYKKGYVSLVQYKIWIADKCWMCTIEMSNVHNTNIEYIQYKSWIPNKCQMCTI